MSLFVVATFLAHSLFGTPQCSGAAPGSMQVHGADSWSERENQCHGVRVVAGTAVLARRCFPQGTGTLAPFGNYPCQMPVFALTPPVHIRGRDKVICSTEKAADLLRELALQLDDPTTTGLVSRLEAVNDPEEAQHAGEEFRAWLGRRNLLIAPPDADTDVPH